MQILLWEIRGLSCKSTIRENRQCDTLPIWWYNILARPTSLLNVEIECGTFSYLCRIFGWKRSFQCYMYIVHGKCLSAGKYICCVLYLQFFFISTICFIFFFWFPWLFGLIFPRRITVWSEHSFYQFESVKASPLVDCFIRCSYTASVIHRSYTASVQFGSGQYNLNLWKYCIVHIIPIQFRFVQIQLRSVLYILNGTCTVLTNVQNTNALKTKPVKVRTSKNARSSRMQSCTGFKRARLKPVPG